jgi:Zn-finger nucleic acid-binding protein
MSNATAQALVAGELASESIEALRRAPGARSLSYREREVLQRSCPDCGDALSKVAAPAEVELDVCSQHGVYFDQGELEVMHRFYVQRAKDQRALEYAEKRAFLKELHTTDEDEYHREGSAALLTGIAQWFMRWSGLRRLDKEYKE